MLQNIYFYNDIIIIIGVQYKIIKRISIKKSGHNTFMSGLKGSGG
jgi:hypothetical protein